MKRVEIEENEESEEGAVVLCLKEHTHKNLRARKLARARGKKGETSEE